MLNRYYLDLTALKKAFNTGNNETDFNSRGIELIESASRLLEDWTQRRFDIRYQMIRHNPRQMRNAGDVVDWTLYPRADLMELVSIVNGQGATLTLGTDTESEVELMNNTSNIVAVTLINELLEWETNPATRRKDEIEVTGFWGYGYRQIDNNITVQSEADDSVILISMAIASGTLTYYENDLIRLGNEIMRVTSDTVITSAPINVPVERGANDSIASIQVVTTVSYKIKYHPTVTRFMQRMVAIANQQDTSPLVATATIGDFSFPVDVGGYPKDVRNMVDLLKFDQRILAS